MPKPYVDEDAARRFVLVMMYEAYVRDERLDFTPSRIHERLAVPLSIVKVILSDLEDDDLLEEVQKQRSRTVGLMSERTVQEWVGTGAYVMTRDGRAHVRKMADEVYDASLVHLASGSAASAVFRAGPAPEALKEPDAWSPLPIEPGSPQVAAVREALDEVLAVVQAENGYAANHPEERAEIIAALSAAKAMFTYAGQFGYTAFIAYVVSPTERLLKRFEKSTIVGGAVAVFVAAVKDWAKSKIGVVLDEIFKNPK
ncbi:hypothetical protein [Phenylobacterium sp.]|uniref:hypothetical protein n=1 Tax=Phenylobacterium sp. TaxID=1871053 RepID=UPI00289A8BAC|nr:hypothetical protein [Phenylobacterium sp.]